MLLFSRSSEFWQTQTSPRYRRGQGVLHLELSGEVALYLVSSSHRRPSRDVWVASVLPQTPDFDAGDPALRREGLGNSNGPLSGGQRAFLECDQPRRLCHDNVRVSAGS
jgi:hypothetical protein